MYSVYCLAQQGMQLWHSEHVGQVNTLEIFFLDLMNMQIRLRNGLFLYAVGQGQLALQPAGHAARRRTGP